MYAIVEIAGRQYRVVENQFVTVNRLAATEGETITLDKVLMLSNGGKVSIGAPNISGATVTAKVESHNRGPKVLVFKKKRRKGYTVKNGFRHDITRLKIESIKG